VFGELAKVIIMDGSDLVRFLLLLVTLVLSAFFSGSEAAFLSIQRGKLAHLTRSGVKGADKVAQIAGHPEKLLPTVLTGNNLVNTAAAAIGTAFAMSFMEPTNAVVVATIVVSVLLLVFSETIPKTIAARNSERFAIRVVGPLRLAEAALLPAVWILERLTRAVGRVFGVSDAAMVAEEEIRALIDAGREVGVVEPSEAEMLERVFRFGDRQLREMMTPRIEVIALEKGATLEEFLGVYSEHSHTRFPVYADSVDNVVGTVSVKDVVRAIATGEIAAKDDATRLLRPAYFVPETKLVGELFGELRGTGYQMVMAADEFGGVAGLVTLKQMVEEIVGRVGEEGVPNEEEFQAIDSNTYQVEGGMHIDEANEALGLGVPDGPYETIAGFMLGRLGHIPTVGEHVQHNGFLLEVTEMQRVRIEQVKVTRVARPSDGETR
jgi:CBS domain containing-hemolysin-like protein